MKRMISLSAAALLLAAAVPTFAMVNSSAVTNRMSRRLLEDKTRSEQRVPVGAVETAVLLRERKEIAPSTSGFSSLSRSRIMTRIHTLRGARTPESRGDRPSRRSIIKDAETMLVLPPALVQTGDAEATVTITQKVTRRTLIKMTENVNRVQVGQ